MTLRFDTTKGKPDTRQVEYEQSIVRLGLEKAEAEKELGRVLTEIENAQRRRNETEADVEELKKTAKSFDDRRLEIQQELKEMVEKAAARVSSIEGTVSDSDVRIEEKKDELKKVEEHIEFLAGQITEKSDKITDLDRKISALKGELSGLRSELNHVKRELEEARTDLKKVLTHKLEATKELDAAIAEKIEVEAQVAILKSDNKGGLDVLASLEGERVRLKEKDEALDRKAADLLVYENRLSKRAKELGVDLNMTFT